MPQPGFRLRAAEEGNLARNNGESRPRFPRWPWSPRLRNPQLRTERGWQRQAMFHEAGHAGSSAALQVQGHILQHQFVSRRWPVASPANLPPPPPATPRALAAPSSPPPRGSGCPRGSRWSWRGRARILPSALRPPGLSIAMTSAGAGAGAWPRILPSWQGCRHSPHPVKSCRQAEAFIPYVR